MAHSSILQFWANGNIPRFRWEKKIYSTHRQLFRCIQANKKKINRFLFFRSFVNFEKKSSSDFLTRFDLKCIQCVVVSTSKSSFKFSNLKKNSLIIPNVPVYSAFTRQRHTYIAAYIARTENKVNSIHVRQLNLKSNQCKYGFPFSQWIDFESAVPTRTTLKVVCRRKIHLINIENGKYGISNGKHHKSILSIVHWHSMHFIGLHCIDLTRSPPHYMALMCLPLLIFITHRLLCKTAAISALR